jgi:hypothetical protein
MACGNVIREPAGSRLDRQIEQMAVMSLGSTLDKLWRCRPPVPVCLSSRASSDFCLCFSRFSRALVMQRGLAILFERVFGRTISVYPHIVQNAVNRSRSISYSWCLFIYASIMKIFSSGTA